MTASYPWRLRALSKLQRSSSSWTKSSRRLLRTAGTPRWVNSSFPNETRTHTASCFVCFFCFFVFFVWLTVKSLPQTVITFENGKLVQHQKWDGKESTIEREIQDGKLTTVRLWASIRPLCTSTLWLMTFNFFFMPTEMHCGWCCGTEDIWESLMFSVFCLVNKIWIVMNEKHLCTCANLVVLWHKEFHYPWSAAPVNPRLLSCGGKLIFSKSGVLRLQSLNLLTLIRTCHVVSLGFIVIA